MSVAVRTVRVKSAWNLHSILLAGQILPLMVITRLVSRGRVDTLRNHEFDNSTMKRLLIHGDPGVRRDDVIEVDGETMICFSVTRNGQWHGPGTPQLWCVVGEEPERELYDRQQYIPHFLDTISTPADEITIVG